MPKPTPLVLTGERTAPGHTLEQYWFARHEVAYQWSVETIRRFSQETGNIDEVDDLAIVDAGCGEGYGAQLLATALRAKVVGLELDTAAAQHAQARYGDTVTVLEANLDDWPVDSDSTDIVVSMQVVEHLWNLPKFWSEAKRVLRPGGLMIITTPNRLTFSPGLGRGEKPTNPFHVEEFDMEQLATLIADAGFAEVTCFGLHHSSELKDWESQNGDLVGLQVEAALNAEADGTEWPESLVAKISSVTNDDFEISPANPDTCADLVITARKLLDD